MARPKLPFVLSKAQQIELQRLLRATTTPQRLALRVRIVLACADGEDNACVAKRLQISRPSVGKWRQRFLDEGLAGLEDARGRGRKASVDPAAITKVLTQVVQPPKGRKRWSCRSMARHAGVSKDTVQRLWAKNELKPHLARTFKLSRDPDFDRKFWDVIGVYLSPPTQAVVLCCDEKSQCQALERTQPGLPLAQGHIQTRTHDYYRHGTVTLFAALNYLNGKIIAQTAPRHRHQEWLRFLQEIDRQITPCALRTVPPPDAN
jgi:transposase